MSPDPSTDYGALSEPLSETACGHVRACSTRTGDGLTLDSTGHVTVDRAKLIAPCANPLDALLRVYAETGTHNNQIRLQITNQADFTVAKPALEVSDNFALHWKPVPADGSPVTAVTILKSGCGQNIRIRVRETANPTNTLTITVPLNASCTTDAPLDVTLRIACTQPNLLTNTPSGLAVSSAFLDGECARIRSCSTRADDQLSLDSAGNVTVDRAKLIAPCGVPTEVKLRGQVIAGPSFNPVQVQITDSAQLPPGTPALEANPGLGDVWKPVPADGTWVTVTNITQERCTNPEVRIREVANPANMVRFRIAVDSTCVSTAPTSSSLRVTCTQPNLLTNTPQGLAVLAPSTPSPVISTSSAGYGVFTSTGRWLPGNDVWDATNITRPPLQRVEYAQGLKLENGKIVPLDKGYLWEVTASLVLMSNRALRVWAYLEGFGPPSLGGGTRNHSGCVNLTAPHLEAYPATLIINDTGPTADLDNTGAGFGSLQVTTDSPGNCAVMAVRIVVKQLGKRSGGSR